MLASVVVGAAYDIRVRVKLTLLLLPVLALLGAACMGGSSSGGSPEQSVAVFAPTDATTPSSSATTTNPPATSTGSGTTSTSDGTTTPPPANTGPVVPSTHRRLHLIKTITGHITPKSVVSNQNGLIFAQNMVYTHTVTVYNNETMQLEKTISDAVDLAKYGVSGHPGISRGGPVEVAFSPDGQFAYVSNYQMYGAGFNNPGFDECPGTAYDPSFVYKISVQTLKIVDVIQVGSVPKYLAVSPDNKYLIVSNWCGAAVSVVSIAKGKEIHRIAVGAYPRGIAIGKDSNLAYIAVMGSDVVAVLNLHTWAVHDIVVGSNPRHLVLSPNGRYLYITLNASGQVAKLDLKTGHEITATTGSYTRSLTISGDGQSLYVVNYESSTIAKLRSRDLKVMQTLPTAGFPIGITYDNPTHRLWVSCYSGEIMVFADKL